MLVSLTIDNVVLVARVVTELEKGLCVLTGETGAGKSMLLDSLGLALGYRSSSSLVRKGQEKAQVTAEFQVPQNHISNTILKNSGLETETEGDYTTLVLRRIVNSDGRSRALINDQPVSISLLREIGETLVEIHGQFETQGLLNPATHKTLLDEYAGIAEEINQLSQIWNNWKNSEKELEQAKIKMEEASRDEEYLRQSIEDLDRLSPEEGEEEKLTILRERLMKSEQITNALKEADIAMEEAEKALGASWRSIERIGNEAKEILDAMDRASAEMTEVISSIHALSADIEGNEHSLPEIDDRLFALKGQARKHGCDIDNLSQKRAELAEQLDLIEHQDDRLADLIKKVDKIGKEYLSKAEEISKKRQTAAQNLDTLVQKELPPLKLDKAKFFTSIERQEQNEWGPQGIDKVHFLVSTNPGSEPGQLNKIASGGEMSRFMLALKVILAEIGQANTLVFDEVDSGIGGSTAAAVGERLHRLSKDKQVLLVTHSPQVAARADHHWIIHKSGDESSVSTDINRLSNEDQRREEIARMLAGAEISDEARSAAQKLLEVKNKKEAEKAA
jgi:DNA repair protein RecN (Recombination protein N)